MPTTKPKMVNVKASMIDAYEKALGSQRETMKELQRELNQAKELVDTNYKRGNEYHQRCEALEKTLETARDQNDQLRQELMTALTEKAEAQGYIQRVLDNDPAPEPVMVPAALMRHEPRHSASMMDFDTMGRRREQPRPWYLRDRPKGR